MKKVVLVFAAVVFGTMMPLFAEDGAGSAPLVREIEKVRTALAQQNISAKEKHDNYARLGRLLNLSGDIEGAADAWNAAVYAETGKRDDTALLESAACYIAMGEWEKAEANVKLCLLTVRYGHQIFLKARYLAAQIEAFKNGNDIILYSLVDDPDYKAARPALYLTLWKLSGKEEFMMKLLTEYPESPEARAMLAEKAGRNYVTDAAPSHFFLYPGRENVIITGDGSAGKTAGHEAFPAY
jgi:tetratricopeptide (TPR) repeat protein